jgi:hypothetical protein
VAADGKGAKYWCTSQLGTNLWHHKWRYRSTVGQANTHMLGCLHTQEHNSGLTACPSLSQGHWRNSKNGITAVWRISLNVNTRNRTMLMVLWNTSRTTSKRNKLWYKHHKL